MSDVLDPDRPEVLPPQARTSLGQPGVQQLQDLVDAATRQLSVDKIQALCGSSSALNIARIDLTDTGVDDVLVSGLTTRISCGSAVLHDVRAILQLNFTALWSYDLKWLGSDSGTKVLGSKANTIELHDIRLPMLQDFVFEIPEVELDDVEAQISPLTELQLGASELTGLCVENTNAPAEGFKVAGLELGQLDISGLQVPGTHTESLSIDQFKPSQPLNIPGINLGPIELPAVEIDDVSSDGAVSVMGAELQTIEAPLFKLGHLFKVKLVVDPVLNLQIGALVLSDLEASAQVESVQASGISSTVCVEGLEMSDIGLEDASVANVNLT